MMKHEKARRSEPSREPTGYARTDGVTDMAKFELWERETLNKFAYEVTAKLLENDREIAALKAELAEIHGQTCAHGVSYFKPCSACDGLAQRPAEDAVPQYSA